MSQSLMNAGAGECAVDDLMQPEAESMFAKSPQPLNGILLVSGLSRSIVSKSSGASPGSSWLLPSS
jgi:hypothetical protein